ncbi:MAG: hypothetical protein RL683_419 [Actinomycetota bacterium]
MNKNSLFALLKSGFIYDSDVGLSRTAKKRSVLVVENEPLLCDLIAKMLEANDFDVFAAGNAATAKRLVTKHDPDSLVIDIDLGPGPNGFDLATAVNAASPGRGVVFLTNLPDPRFAESRSTEILNNAAYLRKSALVDSNALVEALHAVLREQVSDKYRHDLLADRPLARLSKSQLQVLQLVAQGKSNQQIADIRGTSVRAVEAVITRVLVQLEIDGNAEGNHRIEAAKAYFAAAGGHG